MGLVVILGAIRTMHMFRGRAMRALAARWGFRYVGPPAPPKWWWNPRHLKISSPLPSWIAHFHPSGQRMRQIWNVIEGQQNGVQLLIFDSVIGEYKGGRPCTLLACQTEQNPFTIVVSSDRVVQSHGWTILCGAWFLWFSWFMGIGRIDDRLNGIRAGRQE